MTNKDGSSVWLFVYRDLGEDGEVPLHPANYHDMAGLLLLFKQRRLIGVFQYSPPLVGCRFTSILYQKCVRPVTQ